jgi:histidinol-phosphate/aromatic aminotransferase/cobyric acid decarboxylase-like protein/choline kinase
MQFMKLAAGMGRRLRHFTTDKPKCMIEVNGKTLIEHSLDNVTPDVFSRIVLVVGYRQEMIRNLLGDSHNGVPITYIDNNVYDTTNNIYSLYLARNLLMEDDTILAESDLIYEPQILEHLLTNRNPNVVLVDKYKSFMDGTVIKIGGNNEVTAFIPKSHFDYKELDSYYKTINIYKFSRDFSRNTYVPFLEAYCKVLGRNRYYEQVLRVILTLDQKNLKAMMLNGEKWYEIDSIPDLRNAELLFEEDPKEKFALYSNLFGGYWRTESVTDFCYLVNPFFPPQRMVEEIKSGFGSLLACYPSGQKTQCLLASELFSCLDSHLAVGNGAAELISALMPLVKGRMGMMIPTFNEYPARIDPNRLLTVKPKNPNLSYTATDLEAMLDDVDCLVVINPDNPSGNFIPKSDMLKLVGECRRRKKNIIIDESFIDFAVDGKANSLLSSATLEEFHNLIIIKSISKSYGIPGLRLGVAATADPTRIKALRDGLPIWNINSFGEYFLQIAPKYRAEHAASCRQIAASREKLSADLAAIPGIAPLPSQANYILCRLENELGSEWLAANILHRREILIKDCSGKEGLRDGQYIRVAVRTPRENRLLTTALAEAIAAK